MHVRKDAKVDAPVIRQDLNNFSAHCRGVSCKIAPEPSLEEDDDDEEDFDSQEE